MIETFEDREHLYIVMERCFGKDLYSRAPYSEKSSARITGQILSAVAYMHSHDVIHRDLKFDNIMFETNDDDAPIKIIDFGLAKNTSRQKNCKGFGGTVTYMAPEILREESYTSKVDIWSIGVITYMLLSSSLPFKCDDQSESLSTRRSTIIEKILSREITFEESCWKSISPDAKTLIRSMCNKNSNKRLHALEALQSKWLRNTNNLSEERIIESDWLKELSKGLLNYSRSSSIKRLGSLIVAHRMPNTPEIVKLRNSFEALGK